MSGADPVDQAATELERRGSMAFRKRRKPNMAPEESRRQSQLVQSAWRHFGGAAPVIAFLNTRHDTLEAQPLHLAIQSDEGLQRVETLLKQMSLQA